MKRRTVLQGLALTPWLLGGNAGATGSATPEAAGKSLVAGAFGKLPAPGDVKRIVCAGPVPDVLLMSLAPKKMLGISTHPLSERAKKYFPEYVKNLPMTGRIAGRGSTFPLETLMKLKPDLIIDAGNTGATYLTGAERLTAQTGIPYIVVDGGLGDTDRQLRQVGALIGETECGNVLGEFAARVLALAAERRAAVAASAAAGTAKKTRIYSARGLDGLETGLEGSIHTEVLDLVGAQNVAAAAGEKLLGRVSMERLIEWNPEIIVVYDTNVYERIQNESIWKNVGAVKNKRVYLSPNTPFGWVDHPPGINRLLGILWMMHKLDANALESAFHALVQEYFQLFYQYDLSKPELLKLLGEA